MSFEVKPGAMGQKILLFKEEGDLFHSPVERTQCHLSFLFSILVLQFDISMSDRFDVLYLRAIIIIDFDHTGPHNHFFVITK